MFAEAIKKQSTRTKRKKFVPRGYQKKSIEFILKYPESGLFLDPGLGKTAVILHAFKALKDEGIVRNILVVANVRIITSVWPAEIKKWNLKFSVGTLHGGKKDATLKEKHDVYLLNYEGIPWLKKKMVNKMKQKFDMLCLDESSKIKHTTTKRFKLLKKMLNDFKRRHILTGSPAPNGLVDVYGQIYALDQGLSLGTYFTKFRAEFFEPTGYMGYQWSLMEGAEKLIYKRIKHLVLRFDHTLLELPPLTYVERGITLSKQAAKQYKDMEEEFVLELKQGDILAANAASASSKLRQIVGGNIYHGRGKERKSVALHDEKIEELHELVDELQHSPLLVAYEFEHEKNRLLKAFPKAKYIGGGINAKEGDIIARQWNEGKIELLFGQPQSVAHGLNLQEGPCCNIAFYTVPWNLEYYDQFIRRVWRSGQKNKVTVHHIIALNTVDQLVLDVLKRKDRVQQSLLDAMKEHYNVK